MSYKLLATLALGAVITASTLGLTQASRLYLEPAQGTFTKNCPFTVKVMMDTQEKSIKTIDVALTMDKENISFLKLNTGAFTSYSNMTERIAATGETTKWKPTFVFGAFTDTLNPLQGNAVEVASITLKSEGTAENGIVGFYMVPGYQGDDSNIPETKDNKTSDTLTQVTSALYGFVDGDCPDAQASIQADNTSGPVIFTNADKVFEKTDKLANAQPRYTAWYIRVLIIIIILAIIIASTRGSHKKRK